MIYNSPSRVSRVFFSTNTLRVEVSSYIWLYIDLPFISAYLRKFITFCPYSADSLLKIFGKFWWYGWKNLFLASACNGHFDNMCLTVIDLLQNSHNGGSSPPAKCELVSRVWPSRIRLYFISSKRVGKVFIYFLFFLFNQIILPSMPKACIRS